VKLALGTDGAASNSTLDLLEACRDAALLAKVVTGNPHVATIGEVLPMLFAAGSFTGGPEALPIVEGMPADLVLFEADSPELVPRENLGVHLVYSLSSRAARDVVVAGEVVVEKRRHARIDHRELFEKAEAAYARLTGTDTTERIQTFRG
jgi:5-methylthioadenosine/S-adenosylhomocysteine deaminase